MRTVVTPSGCVKGLTSEYWGSWMARFMKSAQIVAAAWAPSILMSVVVVVADPDDAEGGWRCIRRNRRRGWCWSCLRRRGVAVPANGSKRRCRSAGRLP